MGKGKEGEGGDELTRSKIRSCAPNALLYTSFSGGYGGPTRHGRYNMSGIWHMGNRSKSTLLRLSENAYMLSTRVCSDTRPNFTILGHFA